MRDIAGSWFIMEGYRGGSEQLSFYWFTGSSQCLLQQVQILYDSSSNLNSSRTTFLTTLAVRVPQSVCMYTVNLLDSLVFPLIAAVTQWAGILCLFFWLVSVLVLIVVPCIRISYIYRLIDRFEVVSVNIRVLKHTFLLCLE